MLSCSTRSNTLRRSLGGASQRVHLTSKWKGCGSGGGPSPHQAEVRTESGPGLKRVLVANRGEIALRVVRACRELDLEAVAVCSEADRNSSHVWAADRTICIGPAPAGVSYLNPNALIEAARGSGCDAVHPGYGFLAENADFAGRCRQNGLKFIGPSTETIQLMGDKVAARRAAVEAGVPVVPGSQDQVVDLTHAGALARDIGFPILIKASAGGGGRGMRVAANSAELERLFPQACAEAQAAFGSAAVFLEKYLPRVRHIEVQVFGDSCGNYFHLGERDCSVQRRHQKLVEESPSPVLDPATRERLCAAAVRLAKHIGYENAGTVEFIFDMDENQFYFIEMNTRIQVEHPVTEAVLGVDLVREQLCVAAGKPLSFRESSSRRPNGHAIEWRINAEDPEHGFRPSPGRIEKWRPRLLKHLRVDSHVYEGYVLPPFYDSLLAKLIVWGANREEALARSAHALGGFQVAGVSTTVPFFRNLIQSAEFRNGQLHTRWVDEAMSD